jgi:hypothetical protein
LPNRCLHLAQTAGAGLKFEGALFSVQPLAPLHLPMVRAEVPVQVQRCLCSLPQDEQVGIFCKPQATQRILPAVRAEAAAHAERPGRLHSLMSWPLGAAIGTLGRDKVLMVRLEWSTNFLAGCWCSTRSSLNFEICGAVPKYRFKISWSVPTYRLDWIVLGYSRCRPLAPPMSAEPPSSANP